MTYAYTPEEETFTEEETQHILSKLESRETSLVCRIDGITWYVITRAENNEKHMAQYKITLNCHYATTFERFTHTISYVETLNFLRVFKVITFYHK